MVRVENEGVLATLEARQQIRLRQLDQPDGHARAAARPRPRRNQLETSPRRTCRLKTRGADACDAFAIDCMRRHLRPKQYVRKSRGLGGCIPSIDIERRVGFGDAVVLHGGKRAVE
jgi:hypothetical protein